MMGVLGFWGAGGGRPGFVELARLARTAGFSNWGRRRLGPWADLADFALGWAT